MFQDPQLITVSCRFVPYDRWFVTHVDPAWKAAQVKLWLLSKCLTNTNVQNGPLAHVAARRRRSPSPITFAPPRETRRVVSESAEESFGYEEDDEDGDGDEETDEDMAYLSQARSSRHSDSPTTSITRPKRRLPQLLAPASDPGLGKRYTLIRYATGQYLEDEFSFGLYNICSHELLEIHSAELVVTLPRVVLSDYLTPCYHARVSALREVWKSTANTPADTRPKLEWRERWVLIRNGVLSLCREHDDPSYSHDMHLDTLVSIKGADNLEQSLQLPLEHRIICARFLTSNSPEKQKVDTPRPSPSKSSHSHPTRPLTGDSSSRAKMLRSSSALRRAQGSLRAASSYTKLYPTHIAENEEEQEEQDNESGSESALSSPTFAPPPSPQYAPPSAAMRTNFEFDEDYKDSWDNADGGNEADTGSSDEWLDVHGEKIESPTKLLYQGKRRRKRRKHHSPEIEKDKGQWLVLNMKDDDAYHSLLRILHQHSPETVSSSFLEDLGVVTLSAEQQTTPISTRSSNPFNQQLRRSRHSSVSSLPSSLLTAPRASSPSRSVHSQRRARSSSPISNTSRIAEAVYPLPEANFRAFEAKPYPEWRKEMVHRAQVAGLGSNMGGAMMLILLEKLAAQDSNVYRKLIKEESRSKSSRRSSGEHSEHSDENNDGELPESESDRGESDTEWRGWLGDLERQVQCRKHEAEHKQAAQNQDSDVEEAGLYQQYSIGVQPYSQRDREDRLLLEPTATVTSLSPVATVSRVLSPPTSTSSPSSIDSSAHTRNHHIRRKQSASLTPSATPISASIPVLDTAFPKHNRPKSSSALAISHPTANWLPSMTPLNQKTSTASFAESSIASNHDPGFGLAGSVFARRPSLPGLTTDLRRNGSLMGLNIKKRWEENDQERAVARQEKHWQKEKRRQEKLERESAKEVERERRRLEKGKMKETAPEPPKLIIATSPKDAVPPLPDMPISPSTPAKPKRAVLRRPGSKQEWSMSESAPASSTSRPTRL